MTQQETKRLSKTLMNDMVWDWYESMLKQALILRDKLYQQQKDLSLGTDWELVGENPSEQMIRDVANSEMMGVVVALHECTPNYVDVIVERYRRNLIIILYDLKEDTDLYKAINHNQMIIELFITAFMLENGRIGADSFRLSTDTIQ